MECTAVCIGSAASKYPSMILNGGSLVVLFVLFCFIYS